MIKVVGVWICRVCGEIVENPLEHEHDDLDYVGDFIDLTDGVNEP